MSELESAQLIMDQYNALRKEIEDCNFDKALQIFLSLQSGDFRHPAFQAFAAEMSDHLNPELGTPLSRFFSTLPVLIQSNIIEFAKDHYERAQEHGSIFKLLHIYITYYPRYAYKYLIEAINLLILSAQKSEEKQEVISILVTDLFPRLCKQKLVLVQRDIKSTAEWIHLPYPLFEQFLLLGQRFYIKQHLWPEAIEFTETMLMACGYPCARTLQDLKGHRGVIQVEDNEDFGIMATVMCEYMAATCQFVQYGCNYYHAVCRPQDEVQSCLIPICNFQKGEVEEDQHRQKKMRISSDDDLGSLEKERSQGLDSYCVQGVDDTLQVLSRAADCLRHLVELWQWATEKLSTEEIVDHFGSWEQELCRVIDSYKLPFEMHNAILLVRSDLALSSPSIAGNLAKALELSQSICDRIENQRKKKKEVDNIPFMFAFRVLYNISIIYLLVGSLQQSTLEVSIILSVFPIPNELNEIHFLMDEIDCRTVANVFHGREFGLMRVTQEGLVARCIKHLIVGLDNESEQKGGMASIDSALRWDEKAGNMIVMMQYGWPYWNKRTSLWQKVMTKMGEKRIFKNREFLEYLYIHDVLQGLLQVHLSNTVIMDIIPPEFALKGSYQHLVSRPNNKPFEQDKKSLYQPSFSNTILPSTSMSPSWYSASTQKNSFARWMSPSFYYSRPATAVVLPEDDEIQKVEPTTLFKGNCVPREIVTRCLEYRMTEYSPKITPQRMRHVLQRFLKNLVLKANEET
ncbi:hypothetical protein BY458DRAFT_530370 [Sporodiniella umbellata]|nr:hypothetical protein BY458DRAFT_530370 [Sporodiniella umbellata]